MGLISVEPVIMFSSFAYYIESTALQDLIFTKVCMTTLNTTSVDDCTGARTQNDSRLTAMVHDQSALTSQYFTLTGLVSIPICFYIGSWSDMFGRRKPLALPFILFVLSQLSLLTSAILINMNIVPFIYLAAVLDGIAGGQCGILAIAFGYLSDITKESNRTKRNVILESMWYVGGCLGFLTAAGIEYIPFRKHEITFGMLAITHVCIILYIIFGIKEPRKPNNVGRSSLFDIKHVTDCFRTVFKKREPSVRRWLLIFGLMGTIIQQPSSATQTNLTFSLLKRPPLKWDTEMYSLYSSIVLVTSGFGLIVILPIMLKLLGSKSKDSFIVVLGAVFKACGFLCLALATDARLVFMAAAFFTFGDYPMPSIRSLSSKVVEEDERGKILSFLAMLQNTFYCIMSFVCGYLFSTFTNLPGLTFYISAGCQLFLSVVYIFVGCCMEGKEKYIPFVDENCNEAVEECKEKSSCKRREKKA